ncbi:phage minor capsid protein [Streptomyces sp. NPDC001118]
MATPLPSTPGDDREDHAQATADKAAGIAASVELALIATIAGLARKAAFGAMPPGLAARRLEQTVRVVLASAAPRIRAVAEDGLRDAAARSGSPDGVAGDVEPIAQSIDAALVRAASSAQDALTTATSTTEAPSVAAAALSPQRQAVEQAIASTRGGAPYSSLSLSRIQAAQKALDDLGEQGITGFVDRAGRRWNLVSYVEMATRTAVSNAWDDLQAAAMARSGLDLVVVSTHSTEGSCRHCLPWLGRTLSLTGATHGVPTLEDAKAAGFRHPNCRCFWTPFGAGLTADVTNPVPLEHAEAAYKASQRQRALERRVREAGRRMSAAITPVARSKARRDLAQARAASEAHRRKTGLRMTRASVRRREHPQRAH